MDAESALKEALSAGIRFIQYRNKSCSRRFIFYTAFGLSRLIHESGGVFILNDHADIALAVGADGVHLGQDDLPIAHARRLLGHERIIGISTHSMEQAREAEALGADYIGFGPVFHTVTKEAGPAHGLERLSAIAQSVDIPVIAIGGIGLHNVRDVIQAGADGAAVISAILSAPDLKMAAYRMLETIREELSTRKGRAGRI